ncbi:geranylgeranyl pyrophosphate synthetase [Penicillium coprophilum]|uniref:geranylgeranyl pyrophosphate synthetase n=1 Tax=Penicillium coprophilum TaxID=36646 RepID=UPI0023A26F7F|nr:geranylgeranyl pyrophosphate synthetase [Penicillium coprophilum]KAJ5154806.1 geranylgeranyl pyrophosphate synthetase [Penicillium coprophilum]
MSDLKTSTAGLEEISRHGLESSNKTEAIITDVTHLASYNWIEARKPTIAVPGSPALWSAPQGPRKVKKDSGLVYISQNAARHPDSPLEPLFRALYIEKPSFDISSIDVVTDRNNIRKLLSFINPAQSRNGLDPFTIEIDVVAQTAIFCRAETATHEIIGPGEFRGFGHEFEKAYTISQIAKSTGHHRIISYRLGGLSFLVRHETDGCVGDSEPGGKEDMSIRDDLAKTMRSLSLAPTSAATMQESTKSELTIKREGRVVPRESTLEIKTRVLHKPLQFSEVAPQLWISQTPKLVRAYHQHGIFSLPNVEDVTTALRDWEQVNQDDIRKLVTLIECILRVARNWGGSSIIRYDSLKDKLVIEKAERKKMLPDDLYSRLNKTVPVKVE